MFHLTRRVRRHESRGVSTVMFALMAPVLVAAVGLSVDGGKLALERSKVQRAADNAALAVGQDCAGASRSQATSTQLARCTSGGAATTITLALNGNAPGATGSINGGSVVATSGTATVTVTETVPMTFGSAIGVQPKTITASSTVTWNQIPNAAKTLPLTLDVCDYNAWKINPSTTHRLYRYDADQPGRSNQMDPSTCAKPGGGTDSSIKGSLWVVDHDNSSFDASTCLASTVTGDNNGKIFPQNWDFPASCTTRTRALVPGKTYLMAIGESDGWTGWGNGRWPKVRGYAPFVMTGWRFGDKNSVGAERTDSAAPACTGRCRGIQGYFTGSVVQLEGVGSYGTDPSTDYGSIRVKITS